MLSLWVWVCAWNLAVRPFMTCITFLNVHHFEVTSRSTARSHQGQSNVINRVSKKRLSGGNRALTGGYKTLSCAILYDLECPDWLGGRWKILYLQNCRSKVKRFCVEIVQNGVSYLTAFAVVMFLLSPLAFQIDTKVSFQNIMWMTPNTLCFLSARAFFFDLWTKFIFFQSPLLAYKPPMKGFFLLSKYAIKSTFNTALCWR